MTNISGYSQPLRAIGQALESGHIESFDIEIGENNYFVKASTEKTLWKFLPESLVRIIWGGLRDEAPWENMVLCFPTLTRHFELEEIDRLDQAGKAKRQGSNAKPNNETLSQLLRVIGYYADQSGERLRSVSYQRQSLLIVYETREKQLRTNVFDLSFIRDRARVGFAHRAAGN